MTIKNKAILARINFQKEEAELKREAKREIAVRKAEIAAADRELKRELAEEQVVALWRVC